MSVLRAATNAPSAAVMSSGIAPAHPKLARDDAGSPAAGFSVERATATSPFASLKQERTVEAKVSAQLLTMAKTGIANGDMAMGGATRAYQVPEELMALAGRKKAKLASSQPPARDAAVSPEAAGLGTARVDGSSLAPQLPHQTVCPSIAVAAPQGSFNWVAVSVVTYALLCAAYWLALH